MSSSQQEDVAMSQTQAHAVGGEQPSPEVDPITLTVVWNALLSVAEEMGSTLRRTAFSEAVREGDDFSTGVFDARARLIAQGNFTPGHLGSMPYVVRTVLEYFPVDTLRPGDGIFLNDSFLGSGHFPDCFLVSPVFVAERIAGFVVNAAHHVDVGGAAPGSQRVHGVVEAFQEGLRILPIRLVKEGRFDPDLLRMILSNVRIPEKVRGDLNAQLNANRTGVSRLQALFEQHGAARLEACSDAILAASEQRMRELIAGIPDGVYSFDDCLDDYGPDTETIHVCVDVKVEGDSIEVDFSRSSDQVPAALNAYINYTRAYTVFAIKVFCDALLPHNAGGIRPITTRAREGSFFNPRFPAASGGRATVQIRIFDALNGALSKALPERAMGAFSHWSNPNIGGIDERTGEPFVMYDLGFAGYGARAWSDGPEALAPVVNCRNIPVEVHETNNPVRIRRLELIPDSGGAGTYRGGCGLRKDIELLSAKATMTLLGDRHLHAPYGVFGGHAGARARTLLVRDGESTELGSKAVCELRRGDLVSFRLAGAGGYGDPHKRDPDAVRRDLADGLVSVEAARAVYGLDDSGSH
ncbi:MAG: hydantoinase B/oxoprolinase family protein [Gammaproteobacteria bacterium]|nr:hydantoinase B/oxoprolinase family protein [Gammaproteobacteria bacterium]